jgi:hypothetical protein
MSPASTISDLAGTPPPRRTLVCTPVTAVATEFGVRPMTAPLPPWADGSSRPLSRRARRAIRWQWRWLRLTACRRKDPDIPEWEYVPCEGHRWHRGPCWWVEQ